MQPISMMNENTLNYNQYLSLIKKQVSYAKTIYDTLSETVKQVKQPEQQQPVMLQQQLNQINSSIQQSNVS